MFLLVRAGTSPRWVIRERQNVGGPVLAAIGRRPRRTTRRINRLKGTVADLPQPAIFRPPTSWRSPIWRSRLCERDRGWELCSECVALCLIGADVQHQGEADLFPGKVGELRASVWQE